MISEVATGVKTTFAGSYEYFLRNHFLAFYVAMVPA
jgi:hypothetical protein